MRVMYKRAEASAPARGDDHMSSDVVQSVLHLSSACAGKAHTPQLRAAGQTTGVGPGITDVLGVRQRVQEARAPCWSSASALLRPLADLNCRRRASASAVMALRGCYRRTRPALLAVTLQPGQ